MIEPSQEEEESILSKIKDIGDLIDAASTTLATLLGYSTPEAFQENLATLLQPSTGVSLQSKLILLSLLLVEHDISREDLRRKARELISSSLKDYASSKADVVPIVTQGLRASGNLLWFFLDKEQNEAKDLTEEFANLLSVEASQNQLRYELVKVMKYVAKKASKNANTELLYGWVRPLVAIGVKDKYIPVKLCSERILMYILSGHAFKDYMQRWKEFVGDEKEAKAIGDFCNRVISRLGQEDSDNE